MKCELFTCYQNAMSPSGKCRFVIVIFTILFIANPARITALGLVWLAENQNLNKAKFSYRAVCNDVLLLLN